MLNLPALGLHHLRLLPAAGRRDDTVHAQILDHLSVVIEAMSWGKRRQEQARGRPATTRSNRFDEVRAGQGRDRFVAECEGIFQILNDFGLGFHVVRAFAVVDRVRWFLARNRRPNEIVGRGDMLHLLAKRAHTFVFAPGEVQFCRRKIELVLRHRLGRFDDFLLNNANLAIDR